MVFPLTAALGGIRASDRESVALPHKASAAETLVVLKRLSEILATSIEVIVRDSGRHASGALLSYLETSDELLQAQVIWSDELKRPTSGSTLNSVARLLYIVLSATSRFDLKKGSRVTSTAGTKAVADRISLIGGNLKTITRIINFAHNGVLAVSIDDDNLIGRKTRIHAQIEEVQLNLRHFEKTLDSSLEYSEVSFNPHFVTAQKEILGFSANDIVNLSRGGFAWISERTKVVQYGRAFAFDPSGLESSVRTIVDRMTLDHSVLERFYAPFYFDFGTRRKGKIEKLDLWLSAIEMNWSSYYPFFRCYDGTRELRLSTPSLMTFAMANMDTYKGRLLGRMLEYSRGTNSIPRTVYRTAATAARRAHRVLEENVASVGKDAGWMAAIGVARWHGRNLECGEIDVMLFSSLKQARIILLCEVKDMDMPMHKVAWLDQTRANLQRAAAQLERKKEWVRRESRKVVQHYLGVELDTVPPVYLVSVIVTSRYIPPFLVPDGQRAIPYGGLDRLLENLTDVETARWRSELRVPVTRLT